MEKFGAYSMQAMGFLHWHIAHQYTILLLLQAWITQHQSNAKVDSGPIFS